MPGRTYKHSDPQVRGWQDSTNTKKGTLDSLTTTMHPILRDRHLLLELHGALYGVDHPPIKHPRVYFFRLDWVGGETFQSYVKGGGGLSRQRQSPRFFHASAAPDNERKFGTTQTAQVLALLTTLNACHPLHSFNCSNLSVHIDFVEHRKQFRPACLMQIGVTYGAIVPRSIIL